MLVPGIGFATLDRLYRKVDWYTKWSKELLNFLKRLPLLKLRINRLELRVLRRHVFEQDAIGSRLLYLVGDTFSAGPLCARLRERPMARKQRQA
jgi:hypothetical protein